MVLRMQLFLIVYYACPDLMQLSRSELQLNERHSRPVLKGVLGEMQTTIKAIKTHRCIGNALEIPHCNLQSFCVLDSRDLWSNSAF